MRVYFSFFLFLLFTLTSCRESNSKRYKNKDGFIIEQGGVLQGISLLGDSLITEVDSTAQIGQIEKLEEALYNYAEEQSLENLIWIGRREAYLGRYDLAIRTFTKAFNEFPDAYEALRHRGHRFISIREFDRAIEDLQMASELMVGSSIQIEQDGMPNRLNIPLSNVQFNVWYHLGLAHYLKRDWQRAVEAYKRCLEVSDNDDLIVATLDWYYMALVKLGSNEEADQIIKLVQPDMEIIENDAYFKRILMYKGELNPDALLSVESSADDQKLQYVTQGYGLGNYFLMQGDTVKAREVFGNVIKTGYWSAFGYIASEMELSHLNNE